MSDRSLKALFAAPMLALLCMAPALAEPAATPDISGPVTHDNLSIYFIKGSSETGPTPLTLDEALEKGSVKVHETQTVSELEIENTSDEPVFVHAGDIVKGGQQDRVLTVTILVPPKSGRMAISSYCVERGRWAARGGEDVATFASSKAFMPSLEGKRAMRIAQKEAATGSTDRLAVTEAVTTAAGPSEHQAAEPKSESDRQELQQSSNPNANFESLPVIGGRLGHEPAAAPRPDAQSEVWRNVDRMQSSLGMSLSSNVAAEDSPTSLQLALENEKLAKAQAAYVDALEPKGEAGSDVIGLVIAVNGELKSADIYPSNALFRKFWAKHLRAAATEAIGTRDQSGAGNEPAKADVEAFLADARNGSQHEQPLNDALNLEVSDGQKVEAFASRTKDGKLLHMNVLKK